MKRLLIVFVISLFIPFYASSQNMLPQGKFLTDTIKVGEAVKFSLKIFHAANTQILFPDSSYNFFPFELIRKEFYPTVTNNSLSFDSAIYTLRTFELDSIQTLSLPVYHLNKGDSTATYSSSDTLILKEYLKNIPAKINLLESTQHTEVKARFNYPYLIAYILLIIITGLILYLFFGKIIKRKYNLYKIRSAHLSFMKNFQLLHDEFLKTKKSFTIEQALSIWKAYLERLENKPINTYTTTEIINLYNKEELKNGLQTIDRAIYGGLISDEVEKGLITLKRFSNRQFHQRKREIQNG